MAKTIILWCLRPYAMPSSSGENHPFAGPSEKQMEGSYLWISPLPRLLEALVEPKKTPDVPWVHLQVLPGDDMNRKAAADKRADGSVKPNRLHLLHSIGKVQAHHFSFDRMHLQIQMVIR